MWRCKRTAAEAVRQPHHSLKHRSRHRTSRSSQVVTTAHLQQVLFKPARGSSCHGRSSRASAGVVVVASLRFQPLFAFVSALACAKSPWLSVLSSSCRLVFICHFPSKGRVFLSSCPDVMLVFFSLFPSHKVVTMWASLLHGLPLSWRPGLRWLEVMHFHSVASFLFLGHCRSSRWLSETACYHGNHTPPQHCQGDHKLKLCRTVTIATTELILP